LVTASFADPERCRTSAIAATLGVSESHLCHAYRDAYDRTIGQEVRRLRIRAACHLLERSDRLIKEVAAECGYGRSAYRTFLNAFRAETGIAPSTYRSLHLEKDPASTEPARLRLPAGARRAG
jgi:AraC-like DNA-binding protein